MFSECVFSGEDFFRPAYPSCVKRDILPPCESKTSHRLLLLLSFNIYAYGCSNKLLPGCLTRQWHLCMLPVEPVPMLTIGQIE